jgi:hypothetical protein
MTCEIDLNNAIIRLWAAIASLAMVAGLVATLALGQ